MKQVPVTDLKPGDVIADPVCDGDGKRFLPKGIKLNSALIARLRNRSVQAVVIEGSEANPVENLADLLADLDHRFSAWEEVGHMMRLKEIASAHLTGRAVPPAANGLPEEVSVDGAAEAAQADPDRIRQFRERVENAANLPTLPDVVLRINEIIESPATGGRQVGAEIAKDQVLSAKVLKLVNSGLYGFAKPISSIPHAVTMLGFDAVKSLVLSSSVLDIITDAIPGLWEHSQACARTCGLLAHHLQLPDPEELVTIGLLHDLGKVVLHQALDAEYQQVLLRVMRADMLFFEAEEEPGVLAPGLNHGTIGGWLLEKWTLPAKLVEPIAGHHVFRPDLAHPERTAVVHVADVLCRAESFGNGGDRRIPLLQPAALRLLGLGMVEVEAVMNQMDRGLRDIPRVQPGL